MQSIYNIGTLDLWLTTKLIYNKIVYKSLFYGVG